MCCNPPGSASICGYDPHSPTRSKICGVTLVALGVLMLVVTALLIYNLATAPTTEVWCDYHQVVHVVSAKPMTAVPVLLLGIPGLILLSIGFNKFNWSSCISQDSDQPSAGDPIFHPPVKENL